MCEKCEINGNETQGPKDIPNKPVNVKHGLLVIYPDLMQFGKTYAVKFKGKTLWIAKPDLGVISITEA
jgi:hypothetical protein